jgi:hypothetical protein
MKLKGRDLASGLVGEDVKLLQFELALLGFSISEDEVASASFGRETLAAVRRFQKSRDLVVTGVVDQITAVAINRDFDELPLVLGQVRKGDDTPFTEGKVQAFDRDLRREQVIGESELTGEGRYEIRYSRAKFKLAEKRLADLFVRVLDQKGELLFSSEVIFNAPTRLTLDIVLDGKSGLTEFERYDKEIDPLLDGVNRVDLTDVDIDFLSRETGIPEMHLVFLAVAHEHAATTKVDANLFYGLFRENLPTSLPALLTQSPATLRTALDAAIADQVIPQKSDADLNTAIKTLLEQRRDHIIRTIGVSGLLDTAGLNIDQQGQFLEAYLDFEGDSQEFWRSLKTSPLSRQVRSIQNTLQLGLLTQNNVPLIQSLAKRRVQSIRDLVKLTPAELKKMALESKEILAAIPPGEESETDDAKATRFSNELFDVLYDTVPTVFVQDSFKNSTDSVRISAAELLTRLPDFELRDDDLEKALLENPRALEGITDPNKIKGLLKRVQRTLRIASHPQHAQLLLDEGLDSASSITSLSPAAFQERYAEKLGGTAQSRLIYLRAQQVSDSALAIISTLQQSLTDDMPSVIEPVPDSVKSLPNFTTLFGSQSHCTCSHCRSVLSPAAYMVDLLEFLKPNGPKKPIDKLRSKRPDIEHILLTCDNTNTPLPYIDLVNEVLEFYVAQGKLSAEAARDTNNVSAAELNANPQYVIQAAYETLANAVYPEALPFYRSREIVRLYLNHLGTNRHELMHASQRNGTPTELEIACESLQMTPLELQIVTGVAGRPLAEFYSLPSALNPETLATIKVNEFLQITSLTYAQLQEVLKATFLNPNAAIKLVDEDNPPQCHLDRIKLTGLTAKFWQDAHRFLRLRRIVDWTVTELDLVFVAMGINQIDDDTMIRLAAMKQLQSLTKLPVEVLASFVGTINATLPNSLYQRLFLSKAVLSSSALLVFEAVRDGNSTAKLGEHRSTIAAALRLSEADVDLLLEHLGLEGSTLISLQNLSALHRYSVLARTIRLTVRELIVLTKLVGNSPFVDGDPRGTLQFIEAAIKVRESGFTIAQLDYLYYHASDSSRPIQPTLESQLQLLRTLKSSLQATQLTEENSQSPKLELFRAGLLEAIEEAFIDQALRIIEGTDSSTLEFQTVFIKTHFSKFVNPDELLATLQNPANDVDDRRTYIQDALTRYKQNGLVLQILSESLGIDSRLMVVLLQDYLRSVDEPNEPLLQSFLRLTNVNIPDAEKTVSLEEIDANLRPILDGLLRLQKAALLVQGFEMTDGEVHLFGAQGASFDGFSWNDLPIMTGDSSSQLKAWHRLTGWYRLRNRLPQQAATLADVGLAAANLVETGAAVPDLRLNAIANLKKASGWSEEEVDFLVGPSGFNMDQASDFLDDRKLTRIQVCVEMSRRLGVSCSTFFGWATGQVDISLADQVVAAAKAKHTDEQWLSIAKPLNDELRERQKSALVSYVLAHDPAVKKAGITDGNGLFEYFLIDVGMSACAQTSRIKQAIASIQLFVQRSLLNLEDGVSPSSIDVERWEWMKNYRVWEANRKVFLYPENWIEPELRDDKSTFFQELESALLQNEVSWSTAEDAYLKYLEKLDQVARLQPCGMFVEEATEPGDDEIVHVFGRTMSLPHVHYYRKLINGQRWTPWEKLDQEINSDHLIPVVRNRRLYLMWLIFEEKPAETREIHRRYVQSFEHWRWVNVSIPDWEKEHARWTTDHSKWLREKQNLEWLLSTLPPNSEAEVKKQILREEPAEPPRPEEPTFSINPPLTHWEIKLAWIENKDGEWSTRRTSTEFVRSPHVQTSFQEWFQRGLLSRLEAENDKHGFIPPGLNGELEETVFSVHLPKKETHFARVADLSLAAGESEDDGITIWLFRRYAHTEVVFREHEFPIKGYDLLGLFKIHCGNKADVIPFNGPKNIPFESLKRPDGTTNSRMTFKCQASNNVLSVTPDKTRRIILKKGPSKFELLYEHQHSEFRLAPPFQSFFYHDEGKTYYAWHGIDIPSGLLRIPDHAIVGISLDSNVDLVKRFASRPISSKKPVQPIRQTLRQSGSVDQNHVSPNEQHAIKPTDKIALLRSTDILSKLGNGNGLGVMLNSRYRMPSNQLGRVALSKQGLRFETFFHPHICEWMQRLYRDGLPGLLVRSSQQLSNKAKNGKNVFEILYAPSAAMVAEPYPTERVDFDRGAYACYNWELFFHIPMLVAVSLSKNQRFEEAMKWFHFVFNPMTDDPGTSRQRFWNTLPFYQNSTPEHEQIQNLLKKLSGESKGWQQVETQIDEWRSNPFNPHLIARMRLTAYQKHVVMKYIDNIIAWADQLFSRDTLESINEATMLYILAWNVLGKRPQTVARQTESAPKSYQQIAKDLDAFGNALVDVEGLVPYKKIAMNGTKGASAMFGKKPTSRRPTQPGGAGIHKSAIRTPHFCVPPNEEMLRYWDTVEDRLFKIRHCMNIEGISRQLPLFEPPIDPALLVKAKAAGLDLGSVLNDVFAPLPLYRFNVMLQKATELCNELKSLGGALLSALEKRDAEAISNIRASQETTLLKIIRELKKRQIEEAKTNLEALNKTRLTAEARFNYYRDIEKINVHEQAQLDHLETAFELNLASQVVQNAAGIALQAPNATLGTSGAWGSPVATATFGGSTVGAGLQSAAGVLSMIAGQYSHSGVVSSIVGGYKRRWEEWQLQEKLASNELKQIDKQIAAAEIRLAITEKELENHEQQIANSEKVEQFLRSKFTNDDLYNWMIGQTSKVYFQTYKLAYDLAKRAERSYRIELGLAESDFIRFGYWDNLRKGLMAGEQLALDLKRMDVSYLEKNKREYELTKHVSLLQLNPDALIEMRQTGVCNFRIPEWWFDLDNPGHYLRRIKNVSLSIPCVTGPFTGVNCTLSLEGSETRITTDNATNSQDYPRLDPPAVDKRFVDSNGLTQSIVASTAQNDSGLFETNFRDERYLPFENAGVISHWQLRLPADPRKDLTQFDYDTISDVVLHLRYTAREGGDSLRTAAIQSTRQKTESAKDEGLTRLFSLRHEFPTEWAKFQNQVEPIDSCFQFDMKLRREHYPFWARDLKLVVAKIAVLVRSGMELSQQERKLTFSASPTGASSEKDLSAHEKYKGIFVGTFEKPSAPATGDWQFGFRKKTFSDAWVVVSFSSGKNGSLDVDPVVDGIQN